MAGSTPSLIFERYEWVLKALRTGLLEPALTAVAGITRAFPIRKAQSYLVRASLPLPDRRSLTISWTATIRSRCSPATCWQPLIAMCRCAFTARRVRGASGDKPE